MLQILSSGDCSASDACSPTVCLPVDGGLRSSDLFACSDMASGSSDGLPGSYGLPGSDGLPDSATRCWRIKIVVTESGWPWHGGANEPDTTTENARTFNNNLIQRVLNGSGPPSQPSFPINTYIYELFNEDKRPGPDSERNWGLFFTNGTAVYPLSLSSQRISNNSSVFCISKPGADHDKLQSGLNWACGQGHANCSAIQSGQPCYYPDTVQNHASFAYNDYYQKMHSVGGTCDFDGTAQTTSNDPSYGSCTFTGSTNSSSSQVFPPTSSFGPIYPPSASSILGVAGIGSMILAVSVALMLI